MDVLFLDANVLFSAAYRADAGLRRLWDIESVRLVTSAYAAEEARRNLDEGAQRGRLAELLATVEVGDAGFVRDHPLAGQVELAEKDLPVLLAAVQMQATHLVTGDVRHFGHLYGQRVGGVLIVRPAEYLAERATGQ
jgi:uncharacterized protein